MLVYKSGGRVLQKEYGDGTVLESDEHYTVIDFDEHGVRRFVTRLVKLSSSASVAPTKPARRKTRAKR